MTDDLTYAAALRQVKAQVAASKTSFHTGMAALPPKRRNAMYAVYGFCRAVDDIADESPTPLSAARGLEKWRFSIAQAFLGYATDAITLTLIPAIREFHLVEKDFQEIIDGMEMDSVAIVAPDLPTLDIYCDRVASAVGRISVCIFGDASSFAIQVAHHLGRALQLTNILRDLGEDAKRGRLYLPRELLDKHDIRTRDPFAVLEHPALSLVCQDLAAQARDHYQKADAFMNKCNSVAMRPARIMRSYYGALFDKLVKSNWSDPFSRVRLAKWKKVVLMVRGFFG